MKKLLLAGSLLAGFAAHAQITPEKIFADDGYGMVRLNNGDYKYQQVRASDYRITLYNLDHSLYKQFTVPASGPNYVSTPSITYVSNALFDTNPATIEYVAGYYGATNGQYDPNKVGRTIVFSETGAQLAVLDTATLVRIYNTPAGTKLLANKGAYSSSGTLIRSYTRVYSLPGQLALRAATPTTPDDALALPYPNPAQQARITLPYTVPANTTGTLRVYDAAGRPVRTYRVDDYVSRLELSTQELAPGTCLYRVETPAGPTTAQRFVVP